MSQEPVIQNFIDLVRIDSPSGQEEELSQFLKEKLAVLGINSSIDQAGNLFAKTGNIASGEPVLVCVHMDTVEPGRGINPCIDNGILRSDGTTILGADNKAAVAALMTALEQLPAEKVRNLELVFSTREETDGGINSFDFSKLKSRTGLIPDHAAPLGSVVLSSPWILNLDIKIIGKSAHAGKPEQAVNALTIAAKAIAQADWGRLNDETTANIGLISGGSAMNTIPGQVFLTGEIRSFNKTLLDKALFDVRKVFEKTVSDSGARLDFTVTPYCSGYVYEETDPVVSEISRLLQDMGLSISYDVVFGASDANTFAGHGIKVVTIGDACTDPHTAKESISVKDLNKLKDIVLAYITYN